MTLLFGSTEISTENCNRESFLLFGCTETSIENCTKFIYLHPYKTYNYLIMYHIYLCTNQLFNPNKTFNKMDKLVIKMHKSNQKNNQIQFLVKPTRNIVFNQNQED